MLALQLLLEYKAERFNNRLPNDYKQVLDAQVDKALLEHIQMLEELIKLANNPNKTKIYKIKLLTLREYYKYTKNKQLSDIDTWRWKDV